MSQVVDTWLFQVAGTSQTASLGSRSRSFSLRARRRPNLRPESGFEYLIVCSFSSLNHRSRTRADQPLKDSGNLLWPSVLICSYSEFPAERSRSSAGSDRYPRARADRLPPRVRHMGGTDCCRVPAPVRLPLMHPRGHFTGG